MGRFFAVVKGYENEGVSLPQRSTRYSAGYDFEALEDVVIPSIWKNYADTLERVPSHTEPLDSDFLKDMTTPEFFKVRESHNSKLFKPTMVSTGVKANMEDDEVLYLYNRSSNPKRGLVLANGVGVIDSDYFENPDNDGHIFVPFFNFGEEDYVIKKGDRIAQGIFSKYLTTNKDNASGERTGGVGSTGI